MMVKKPPRANQHFKAAVSNPTPRRGNDVIRLHGKTIPDPYKSLEDIEASGTRAWIQYQESQFKKQVAGYPDAVGTKEFLSHEMSQPKKGIPCRAGRSWIFYHNSGHDDQDKLMISDTPEGDGRALIDPIAIDPTGNTSIKSAFISPDGTLVGYLLSENGHWASSLRIKNIETGEDLSDTIGKAGYMWWDKDNQGFTYRALARDGSMRVVLRHHTLGENTTLDPVAHEVTEGTNVSLSNARHRNHTAYHGPQEWLYTGQGDFRTGLSIKDPKTGAYKKLFDMGIAEFCPVAETDRGVLMWTTYDAPKGKVVLFNPENPAPQNWQPIIPEQEKDSLQHVFFHQGRLFALYTHNCADQIRIFDTAGKYLGEVPLPPQTEVLFGHSAISGISLGTGAPRNSRDDLFLSISGFKEPGTLYKYDVENNTLAPLDPVPESRPQKNWLVEQLWAKSKDGTDVPMTVIRKPDVALDGTAALKISGYGGFGSAKGPQYEADIADFVESGGIYVQTNVRGGGEFGSEWHEQGRLLNKQHMFDDFISCAKYLVDNNYTSSPRMIAEGTSNGGLLVLGSMIQAPELFGAVIANVPVADMLGANHADIAKREYGDIANPAEFAAMTAYCPLLNIRKGQKYPPCLVRTATHDQWLIGGALKFVAAMQYASPDSLTLLHVEEGFDHSGPRPKSAEIQETVYKKAFTANSLGPIDQNAYKREWAVKRDIVAPVIRPNLH